MKCGMRPRTVSLTRILLLALLLRCSNTFMVSPPGEVMSARGIAVGGQVTRRVMISSIPEERYLRRERLATLGRVRWRRHGSNDAVSWALEERGSFATGVEEGDGRGAYLISQEEDRSSSDLLSATVRPVRVAATAAMEDRKKKSPLKNGMRRVRKAIHQVLRPSSPGSQVCVLVLVRLYLFVVVVSKYGSGSPCALVMRVFFVLGSRGGTIICWIDHII